jgi:hypothetical protein
MWKTRRDLWIPYLLLALAPSPGEPRRREQRTDLRLSCVEATSNRATVVSPEALGAFLAEEAVERPWRNFHVNKLGLNDNHCEFMAQELARRDDAELRPMQLIIYSAIDLRRNPSIGKHGYEALLGLLNRGFGVGRRVEVDDQNWKTTFDLAVYMNREYDSGRFLKNGVFSSKAMWVNFLAELSNARYITPMRLTHCHLVHSRIYSL